MRVDFNVGVLLMQAFILFLNTSYALQISYINYQAYTKIPYMAKIEDFPEILQGQVVKTWILEGTLPVEDLVENTNINAIPLEVKPSFGWTLKRTNMKMYPTDETIHGSNKDIDLNQYTLLEPFTFLAILHISKDKKWLYVQSPFMRGWVKKEDVLIKERDELLKIMSLPFLVVIKPKLYIKGIEFGLGSKIPYVEKEGNNYEVLLPDGSHELVTLSEGFSDGYLSYSQEVIKNVLEGLIGEPYDWGGKYGYWDCSALVKDVFSLFGLDLPRNSQQQMQVGIKVKGRVRSYTELKDLLRELPPFRTLIFLKGHVMIYGGMQNNDPVIYHSLYGIVRDDGTFYLAKRVEKNRLEGDMLTNIYKRVISINVLP
ncbi:SH3 domain-containing protein [Hydrogenobacter thermophilus]|uniref:SH3 domain-containing protein n=1 Tax=Hydrogenobacter thermophilus TaxID=940 RepID=UPI0030F4F41A